MIDWKAVTDEPKTPEGAAAGVRTLSMAFLGVGGLDALVGLARPWAFVDAAILLGLGFSLRRWLSPYAALALVLYCGAAVVSSAVAGDLFLVPALLLGIALRALVLCSKRRKLLA